VSALTIPVHLGKLAKRVHGGKGQEEKKGGQFVLCMCCVVVWGAKWWFMQNNLGGMLH